MDPQSLKGTRIIDEVSGLRLRIKMSSWLIIYTPFPKRLWKDFLKEASTSLQPWKFWQPRFVWSLWCLDAQAWHDDIIKWFLINWQRGNIIEHNCSRFGGVSTFISAWLDGGGANDSKQIDCSLFCFIYLLCFTLPHAISVTQHSKINVNSDSSIGTLEQSTSLLFKC